MFKKQTKIAFVTLMAASALTPVSFAQSNEELKEEVNTLNSRLAALEALVTKLTAAGDEVAVAKERELPGKTVTFSSSDPAPTLKSANGKSEFNIRGRMFIDWSSGSDDNGTFDYSGTKLRAAWFGVEGKATKNIKYKFEADFGGNGTSVKDAYLQFKRGGWSYTVGQSKIPNSLEWNTAISQTSLMERGTFKSAFGFGRGMGIKVSTSGDNWGLTGGVFQGGNTFSSNTEEGWIAAARANYGGKFDSGTWVVGVSGRIRDLNDKNITYKAKAANNQSGTMLSLSGTSKDSLVAAEAAFSAGPIFGAAEYALVSAEDVGSQGRNASLSGGYVELGYVLTGESRPLSVKKGSWGRPKVANPFDEGGMGMWQVTARYDTLDLTDNGAFGGEQETYVLGLSWYMTRYIRTMFDYGHSKVSDRLGNDNAADTVGLRLNVDW